MTKGETVGYWMKNHQVKVKVEVENLLALT